MHLLYLQQLLILPGSPGNTRSWEFAHQWWESGWEVTICTSHSQMEHHPEYPNPDKFPFKWTYKGLNLIIFKVDYSHMMPFSRRILSFGSFYHKVQRYVDSLPEVDMLLAYTAPLSVAELGKKLAQRLGVPFFLEVADVWPDVPIAMGIIKHPWLIQWLRQRTNAIYEEARHIFPYSPGMKEQILSHGVKSEKVTPILNGSQPQFVSDRALLTHPKGKVRVLYTGTIGIANDLSQLIHAMKQIEDQGDLDIELNIVGDGNEGKKVRQLARSLDLKTVHFHPKVPKGDLKRFWDEADIGVVSFKAVEALEANGATKFFDYLNEGIPVVINYQGWQADYLRTFNCGLSSEQGDVAALARNIRFLATYPTVRLRMGGNGRRLALSQFNRQILARQMQEILQREVEEPVNVKG